MPTTQAKIGRFSETSALTEWMDLGLTLFLRHPKKVKTYYEQPGKLLVDASMTSAALPNGEK
jgi:hypothetical protein